ncbi:hypothetical protein PMAYCL1PPCAC_12963, partial [Pristionchus mayeri]
NSSAVSGRSLAVAYTTWNYPYFYQRWNGPVGFLAEIWKSFDYDVSYLQYPYESDSSSLSCDGVLQSILRGTTITSAGGSTPNLIRSSLFTMSLPVYYTAFQFFEAARSEQEDITTFSFFAVFSVPALVIIIIFFSLISAVNYIIMTLRRSSS